MSLVLYKTPNPIDLVHNLLFFKIKGTDHTLTEGLKAELIIDITTAPSSGDVLTLTFLDQDHVFLFTSNVNQSLPPGVNCLLPIADKYEVFLRIANYMPIKSNYSCAYMGTFIALVALLEGDEYDITGVMNPDNSWSFESISGIINSFRSNYHFLVQVFANKLSDTGTFSALPEFRIDPDGDQLSHIELGRIIRPRFLNFFELPDMDLSAPVKGLIPVVSYYLVIKEMSGQNLISTLTTSVFKGVNGKVNHASHPNFNLRTWINSEKKFLTNMPSQVYTNHSAKHYLYYLSPFSADTAVRVKMDINSKDAALAPEFISEAITLKQDETMLIPFTQMLANITSLQQLVYVSVSLINSADATIANPITFIYLPKKEHNRAFLFQNRLGVFDTVITQVQSNTLKVSKEGKRTILTPGYSSYIGDLSSDDPEIEDTFTAETGPITAAMAQHYKELAASRVVFLQSDDRFIRVWIEKGSFKILDEDNELHNVKFNYKSAFADDILSTDLKLPEPAHEDYSLEYLKTDYS
ncbi:hypothetical protein E9993_14615 [Labilibacter sediminis]|nr:hypothetical protein E9993_14615 [Labilibacter sediminis]